MDNNDRFRCQKITYKETFFLFVLLIVMMNILNTKHKNYGCFYNEFMLWAILQLTDLGAFFISRVEKLKV